ncbi:hypothetical protein PC116_g18288 [Phytophthora cactorum]|uniref:Uncharacterized protein n=1 Tax=Phytophthora cactorum TaxID=29920 RepID=A0A8T1CTM1_9STRA|nr:hypothetical protein Pcac1_g3571 [Phytophthora cactorum]KAG2895760.1 hypothetical protein PC114_g15378 [Phytophthora cactorum]KAG2926585.1 hypothetical protein PC117_g14819 [Phytophthora cactorum]KAG3011866.1 hypothetical protein PC120_g14191 [Phytophthora cactorum]KAG3183461.1 hypothetical protein C6341_g5458 [Phytophthora cactorum]
MAYSRRGQVAGIVSPSSELYVSTWLQSKTVFGIRQNAT